MGLFATKLAAGREADLTLQKAIDICRANEATTSQMKSLSANNTLMEPIDLQTIQTETMNKQTCERCGGKHNRQQSCPAIGAECRKCGRKNHFARVCRTRIPRPNLHTIQHNTSADYTDSLFIGGIQRTTKFKDWKVTIALNNQKTAFKIDTGAQCNVIPKCKYHQVSKMPLQKSMANLVAFGGHKLNTAGKASVQCQYRGKQYTIEFEVIDQDVPCILGLDTCIEMNVVQRIDTVDEQAGAIYEKYSDVFDGLGCINNIQYHINIDQTCKPVIHPPRCVPVTLRPKIQDELKRMEELNVIEKVEGPTEWVNSMVTIIKPNGQLRICIDPRDLNKAVKREYYPMRTIEEVVTRMPNARYFSVLDASSGYWQVSLDMESANLCTFNTPFGRYKFNRLPFGLSCAQDVFQRIMSEMFEDIEGVEVVVDDVLIWGETEDQHDSRLVKVLERARSQNLKLNRTKCQIKKHEITYLGHILSKNGMKPDPKKTQAITDMTAPTNKEDLQRFLGMLTYLVKFIPNLSQVSAPLRSLLEQGNEWQWHHEHEESFTKLKELAIKAPVLAYFKPSLPTKLSVDASSKGLGAVLLQNDHPIAYASKALTKAQQNYAQIEKEMLAIVYGCTKFHEYIYGMPNIEVESDHKPLEAILKKPLYQAPVRLQKMIMTIQKYSISVIYRPGKQLAIADALSRAFLPEQSDDILEEKFEINVLCNLPISEMKLSQLKQETQKDTQLSKLMSIVKSGWPQLRRNTPNECSAFWNYRDEISTTDGILFKGERVIIPSSMRAEMLKTIHSSHLGIEKCKQRARDVLFWPGMISQIQDTVSNCTICNMYHRSNAKEPLSPHKIPHRPWARVGADLFELNNQPYLILVDYYSGFIEVNLLQGTTSKQIITYCKSQFSRHGIPDILITDNGPQFASTAFKQFATDYGFEHCTTSPHYPQSNGMAEKAVQTAKNLLKKAVADHKDPYLALLEYRNTPVSDQLGSPAQRLMGRRTKTLIPTCEKLLQPKIIKPKTVIKEMKQRKEKQKIYYDRHTRPLKNLVVGDSVMMQVKNYWKPAKVTAVAQKTPRSYEVQTTEGQTYRRNRRHLRKVPNATQDDDYFSDDPWDENDSTDNSPDTISRTQPPLSPSTVIPLRRSQRTIKKPERYSDLYY